MPVHASAVIVATTIFSYFIGALPFGYLLVHFSLGKDLRTMGSGNIGATNVHRTLGGKAGVLVLGLDIMKGLLAVWVTALLTHGDPLGVALATAAVMLGHCYPVFLGFKGGKAVACFIGAFCYVTPLAFLAIVPVFLVVVAISRYISLGSIVAALFFPFAVWRIERPASPILTAAIFAAVLIVYRHKSNIRRLASNEEHTFSLRGGSHGDRVP